jgi:hypothetical protein
LVIYKENIRLLKYSSLDKFSININKSFTGFDDSARGVRATAFAQQTLIVPSSSAERG